MFGSWADLRSEANGFLVYGVTRRAGCGEEFTGQGVEFRIATGLKSKINDERLRPNSD